MPYGGKSTSMPTVSSPFSFTSSMVSATAALLPNANTVQVASKAAPATLRIFLVKNILCLRGWTKTLIKSGANFALSRQRQRKTPFHIRGQHGQRPARSEERRVGKSGSVSVDLGGRRIIK